MCTKKEDEMSITLENLESALAGESMAHIKYRYFAKLARAEGFEDVAKHFEETADQEIKNAWGHLELLIGKPDTRSVWSLLVMVKHMSLLRCILNSNVKQKQNITLKL